MMTSNGGGYCDCGDPEAWKQFPNCELHMPKSSGMEQTSESYIAKLPSDLSSRAKKLFKYLFEYIHEILTMMHSEELLAHLTPEYLLA
jgi:hypothetical protein